MKLTNPASREYQIMNINLKTYNKILKRSIYAAKQHFLESTFNKYKSDIRNTWKTIYIIIRHCSGVGAFPRPFCVPNSVALASLTLQVGDWAIH